MRPKKPSPMTSSMSRDDDDVTVTSSQDGGVAKSEFLPRPAIVDPPADNNNYLGQGQRQGHCQGQGLIEGQVEKPQLKSGVVDNNSRSVQTTSCGEKPQKPVKPKNLLKIWRSHDNGVTSQQSGSTLRSSGSPDVGHSTSPRPCRQSSLQSNVQLMTAWTTLSTETVEQCSSIGVQSGLSSVCSETSAGQTCPYSNDKHGTTLSTQSFAHNNSVNCSYPNTESDVETACRQVSTSSVDEQPAKWTKVSRDPSERSSGVTSVSQSSYSIVRQTSPESAAKQLTDWTTLSTEPSHGGLSSAHDVQLACGHDSPCSTHDRIAPWTTLSTPSSQVDILSQPSEASCGHISPRCDGEQPQQWTNTSNGVLQDADGDGSLLSFSDRIEPPIIYDLVPGNLHIRRGESLQLIAQFTAYPPPPDISWYRANELLTPGQPISIISSLKHSLHLDVI